MATVHDPVAEVVVPPVVKYPAHWLEGVTVNGPGGGCVVVVVVGDEGCVVVVVGDGVVNGCVVVVGNGSGVVVAEGCVFDFGRQL